MSQTARSLLAQADDKARKVSGKRWISFLTPAKDMWSDAADSYVKAAVEFRVADEDNEAGAAFEKAGDILWDNTKGDEPGDAVSHYQEAFKLYRKDNPQKAIHCQTRVVDYYRRENPRRAAGFLEPLAQLKETELGDVAAAIKDYEEAAKIYDKESNSKALANKIWLKLAEMAATEGDYLKAIENFEKVAVVAVENNLLKWSVKEYFLKAGLCHLATGDMVATNKAFAKYRDLDPTFPSTREHQLLIDLAEAVQAGDQEVFADKLFKYDQMSKLDKWKTTILLRIKNAIEEAGEDFS